MKFNLILISSLLLSACSVKPTIQLEQIGFAYPGGGTSVSQSNCFFSAVAIIKVYNENGAVAFATDSPSSNVVKLNFEWRVGDANAATIYGESNQSSILLVSKPVGLIWPSASTSNVPIFLTIKDRDDGTVYTRGSSFFRLYYQ